jgi:hypothetical protein
MTIQDGPDDIVSMVTETTDVDVSVPEEIAEKRAQDNQQMERIHNMKVNPDDTKSIVEAALPFYTDDTNKAKYLSWRLSGFSVLESCHLGGFHIKTIHRWRDADQMFKKIDVEDMGDLRSKLSSQFLDREFTRNFRLVLEKDFKVLMQALYAPDAMSKLDADYMLKLRSHYTPQSLAMIKQLVGGGTVKEPFDFSKYVLTLTKEKTTMEI